MAGLEGQIGGDRWPTRRPAPTIRAPGGRAGAGHRRGGPLRGGPAARRRCTAPATPGEPATSRPPTRAATATHRRPGAVTAVSGASRSDVDLPCPGLIGPVSPMAAGSGRAGRRRPGVSSVVPRFGRLRPVPRGATVAAVRTAPPRVHGRSARSTGSRPARRAGTAGRPRRRVGRGGTRTPRRARWPPHSGSGRRADGRARRPAGPRRTSCWARPRATVTRFDFGAQARCTTAWARLSWASGSPTNSTARAAASATTRARGSASPMSSLARMTRRRAMNRASSPDSSIRASQYRPASGSEPRIDLMKALTWS